jgi:hypothetical protein
MWLIVCCKVFRHDYIIDDDSKPCSGIGERDLYRRLASQLKLLLSIRIPTANRI